MSRHASDAVFTARPWWIRTPQEQSVAALKIFVLTLFIFPTDLIIKPIGASGYVASLVALTLLLAYAGAVLLGAHNPLAVRHPTRVLIAIWCILTFIGYAVIQREPLLSVTQRAGADRWLLLVLACSGVVLVAAEGIPTLTELRRVARALVLGAAICSTIAALQYWVHFDVAGLIRDYAPGLTVNSDYSSYQDRAGLRRVTGTTLHPIELGVVAGLVLPVAVALALHDHERSALRRWGPVVLIATCIPTSVSRSALIAVALGLGTLVVLLPATKRVTALALAPVAVGAVFLSTPGYIGTLSSFIGMGADDSSVSARLQDYPLVERLVSQHPWFGWGGGTHIPQDPLDIFDNQYLTSLVELGVIGSLGLIAYFALPAVTALTARRRSADPELQTFAAAIAGSCMAGAACGLTFDSMSFGTFVGVFAVLVGMAGACWVIARSEAAPRGTESGPGQSGAAEQQLGVW